ncbi:TenA family protein [Falsihalocynthiibacter sp. BN13B15]|uniref:TenA family protein n=1 Tax=Falsihalocynthiibacter sp. BN13B15 TaxID=3240871 RepID=UPI00350F8AE9
MIAPDYGKSFALWREGAAGAWQDYTRHAFVEGLRDGSLPREAFVQYLIQDYVFLVHFSRAWSLAVVKSETLEEMKVCAATVDALVNHEMSLHVSVCATEGIDEAKLFNATEAVENLAYTRYVLDAGLQGDFLDLMAALAPCVMGYGEIGLRLAESKAPDTPYADWINTYANPGYQSVCARVGSMIDGAVARRIGKLATSPRVNALQDRFSMATTLEVGFWQMGLNTQ